MADQVPPDELTTTENAAAVEIPLKLRVHALAKLLGVTSKQVLAELAALGEQVKTAHSSVERPAALRVQAALAGEAPAAPKETAEPAAKATTEKAPKAEAAPKAAEPAFTQPLFLPPEPAVAVVPPKKRAPAKKTAPVAFTQPTADVPAAKAAPAAPADQVAEPVEEAPAEQPPAALFATAETAAPAETPEISEPAEAVEASGEDEHDADDSDDSDGGRSRRRRRGRRGRGRGRGEQHSEDGSDDGDHDSDHDHEGEDSAPEAESVEVVQAEEQDAVEHAEEDAEELAPRSSRRRSRRRSGGAGSEDQAEATTGAESDATTDADSTESAESAGDSDDESGDAHDEDSGEDDANGSSRRRRRRRRRRSGGGDDEEATQDDPPNTVVHEREPRNKRTPRDEVQGISGSTRLEAKRQRRRDGREAGRRRPPILSESEFLARREAVDRVMVVREKPGSQGGVVTQVGVLEDKILVEHFVTSAATPSIVGNVYVGRVQNVLPSMEAAFIDIGRGRNGVLYAGEVDWAAAGLGGSSRKIEQALRPGDQVLVQVSKDPVGHKGARLTTQISMAGRFLVYVPGGSSTGISRKLPDTERARLKAILKQIVPANAGVIIRTASEGVSEDELARDVDRLQKLWESIQKLADEEKASKSTSPKALYEEPDLLVKVVRDLFNEDFAKLVIDGDQAWDTVSSYIGRVAPDLMERVERYDRKGGSIDAFAAYRIDEQLVKALDRKVWLPSGGTLVIDRTEAMTVVDVNTGKYTGSGGNLEETVTRNNLEAAEEVVRQMRLRDIGGMIVVDFIDMVLESNRDLVLRRLTEALGRDRTRHQVSEVTSLGLVQMTRKRMGTGLIEAFSSNCEHCHGRGLMIHADPIVSEPESDAGRSGRGEPSARRGRRGKGADAPAAVVEQSAEPKASSSHSPAEHPMFKAMVEHDETGEAGAELHGEAVTEASTATEAATDGQSAAESTGQERPSRRDRSRRGQRSAGSTASQPDAATESDADARPAAEPVRAESRKAEPQKAESQQSEADAKSEAKLDAMAKIEAAVARSAGPRKRGQQAPGGRRGAQADRQPVEKPVVEKPVMEKPVVERPVVEKSAPAPARAEKAVVDPTVGSAVQAESAGQAIAAPAPESGPPARRRSRRAARPAAAPVEHAEPKAEKIRSEIIVPAAQPAAEKAADVVAAAPAAAAAPADAPTADAAAPVRRPRRRAVGRQAGPPVAP